MLSLHGSRNCYAKVQTEGLRGDSLSNVSFLSLRAERNRVLQCGTARIRMTAAEARRFPLCTCCADELGQRM